MRSWKWGRPGPRWKSRARLRCCKRRAPRFQRLSTHEKSRKCRTLNDLSFVAQTAAGSVMNNGMGFGNFASFGVSASSNLFTLNGMYDNDPFLNLNNSGATNLLLGNNEVQEATVVTNGYSGQYGGFAGANVNYITKSGSNNWHGNANYFWDGSAMNANNFFNVGNDTPRPFVNANQYSTSFGGPIKKDKAFFFVNYEGLR